MLSCALIIGQISPALAAITNTAVANGEVSGVPLTSPPSSASVDPVPAAPIMTVEKTAVLNDDDGTPGLSDGDTIDFQISVTNDGNVSINSVTLTDTITQGPSTLALDAAPVLTGGDDVDPGVLNVDEVWTYEATYTIQQADIDDGGDITNLAVFDGETGPGPTPVTGQDDAVVPLDGTSSIAVTKTPVTTSYARPGDSVTWAIVVTNDGATTLTGINVTDDTADSVVCDASGDATVASLAPTETENCTATYSVLATDITNPQIENTVSVVGTDGGATVGDDATATMPREDANLVTVKTLTSGNTTPSVGETVTYAITVTNNGSAEATQISLTDQLPAGLTATANNGTTSVGSYDGGTGIWTIASLADSATATLTLEGTVDSGQGGNIISNTVSAATSVENDPTDDGDILTAIFTPVALPIVAVDDVVPAPIDGAFAVPGVINVFDGDTLGTNPVDETTVSVTTIGTWPADITLNPDGSVDVAAGTPTGTYVLEYEICEIADPDNCDTATVTIPVESSLPRLAGTVYLDRNQSGDLDPADTVLPDYIVQLVSGGVVVGETVTDANGEYEFTGFEPGTFDVVFLEPGTRRGVGVIRAVDIGAGETILDQNQPVDPSGVVYDSLTGAPVPGATVTLVDSTGSPLPEVCLLPAQQNRVTDAGGDYRFDILTGADPACPATPSEYRIEITPPAGYLPLPSTNIPPSTGPLDPATCGVGDTIPGGACNVYNDDEPAPISTPAPYYLDFLIGAGDRDVVYNHIPLDPIPTPSTSGLTLEKTAAQTVVRLGDTINYTITVTNSLTNPFAGVYIRDTLPSGTVYTPNSAIVDGTPVEPDVNGRILNFGPLTIPGSGTFEITLSARIGQQVSATELTNIAQGTDVNGNPLTNVARATVRLEVDPVFACSTIIGRVYDDLNRNGYPDDGEPGLPGVRVATVKGLLITTDQYGRYSVPCAELPDPDIGSNFLLKLDTRSLPTGYRVTSENPRTVRVTAGKMTTLNFGAAISRVVRIELTGSAFKQGSAEPSSRLDKGIDQLVRALETKPSVLNLTYFDEGEGTAIARQRLAEFEKQVRQRLRRSQIGIDLWIETRIIKR